VGQEGSRKKLIADLAILTITEPQSLAIAGIGPDPADLNTA